MKISIYLCLLLLSFHDVKSADNVSAGRSSRIPTALFADFIEKATGGDALCTAILLTDEQDETLAEISVLLSEMNVATYLERINHSINGTLMEALKRAKLVRQSSWCSLIILMENKKETLIEFGELSLESRLMRSPAKLMVISENFTSVDIGEIMESSWTFSLGDTVIINAEIRDGRKDWSVFSHLPYDFTMSSNSDERGLTKKIAKWTEITGFVSTDLQNGDTELQLYPTKFENFKGAEINVTALPFEPYWTIGKDGDEEYFKGVDFELISALSKALNFKLNVMETENWGEVTKFVQERKSYAATVIYAVFPKRLEEYDFTIIFEYTFLAFSMAKPGLKPRWQSLYRPFANETWLAFLCTLLLMPIIFILIVNRRQTSSVTIQEDESKKDVSLFKGFLEILAIMITQAVQLKEYQTTSSRTLICFWLMFALIVTTAYRSNLTAYLTLPVFDNRPETLSELVKSGASVTMLPYGTSFRDYFLSSTSEEYRLLGERFIFVDSLTEGLQRELEKNSAHIAASRYQELTIAEQFTEIDGSTRIYIAKESITPGMSAWPMPHDAPYKQQFDKWIQAVLEAGLYNKWSEDFVAEARQKSRRRLIEESLSKGTDTKTTADTTPKNGIEPLSLDHMQGPLYLLLFGGTLSILTFAIEFCAKPIKAKREKTKSDE